MSKMCRDCEKKEMTNEKLTGKLCFDCYNEEEISFSDLEFKWS